MAKQSEVKWTTFGEGDDRHWIVIDDRLDVGKNRGDIQLTCSAIGGAKLTAKGWWKNVEWAPLAMIPIDGRFTPDELKKRAQVICDTLNAQWVKDEIEGKS